MSRTNGTNSSFSDLISEQIKGGDERRTLATRGGGRGGGVSWSLLARQPAWRVAADGAITCSTNLEENTACKTCLSATADNNLYKGANNRGVEIGNLLSYGAI